VSFEEWFFALVDYSSQSGTCGITDLIVNSPFMYEDYHECGMTPEEAYHAEWG